MASFFSSLFNRNQPQDETATETTTKEASIFPADNFSMIQGEANGQGVMGSVNKGYKDYSRKAEFPWCLHIGIALSKDGVQENGLPLSSETDMAYQQEEELLDAIKNIGTAHFIGHLFNDGFLDAYVYLAEPQQVHDYLQTQINKPGLIRGFGYEINKDEDWVRVEVFLQ